MLICVWIRRKTSLTLLLAWIQSRNLQLSNIGISCTILSQLLLLLLMRRQSRLPARMLCLGVVLLLSWRWLLKLPLHLIVRCRANGNWLLLRGSTIWRLNSLLLWNRLRLLPLLLAIHSLLTVCLRVWSLRPLLLHLRMGILRSWLHLWRRPPSLLPLGILRFILIHLRWMLLPLLLLRLRILTIRCLPRRLRGKLTSDRRLLWRALLIYTLLQSLCGGLLLLTIPHIIGLYLSLWILLLYWRTIRWPLKVAIRLPLYRLTMHRPLHITIWLPLSLRLRSWLILRSCRRRLIILLALSLLILLLRKSLWWSTPLRLL